MTAYEVLGLVLGSLIARELMAMGLKAITGEGNGKTHNFRLNEVEKDMREVKEDIRSLKKIILKIAIKLNIEERELDDLM